MIPKPHVVWWYLPHSGLTPSFYLDYKVCLILVLLLYLTMTFLPTSFLGSIVP